MILGQRRRNTVTASGPSSAVRSPTKRANSMDKHSSGQKVLTEQLLPNPRDIKCQRSSGIVKGELHDINLRVLLLPPWPSDVPPFAKSTIDLRSRSGCVNVEVNRLPGAVHHFFQLTVISEESSVTIVLPSDFQGAVSINQGESRRGRVSWSSDFDDRVRAGAIRMDSSQVFEDEDEVFVMAPGYVHLCLMERTSMERSKTVWTSLDPPVSPVDRLKRLLSFA